MRLLIRHSLNENYDIHELELFFEVNIHYYENSILLKMETNLF